MRIGVGGAIGEIVRVEHHHVGAETFAQQAAVLEFQRARRGAGHFVDGGASGSAFSSRT